MDKEKLYRLVLAQVSAILDGEDDMICAMANVSAAIWETVPGLNWAGFYRARDGGLILGPFQGKAACTRITSGRGVCGAAMAQGKSQLVPDVRKFPGHIACDSASTSEVAVPLYGKDGDFLGVLDVDSPELGRFDGSDLAGFEAIGKLFNRF